MTSFKTANEISWSIMYHIVNLIHSGQEIALNVVLKDWVNTGSGNGLSPVLCQAITYNNADLIWIISHLAEMWNISIVTETFSFTKIVICKVAAISFCSLNVLILN